MWSEKRCGERHVNDGRTYIETIIVTKDEFELGGKVAKSASHETEQDGSS